MEINSQRPSVADGLCSDSHFFCCFVLFLIPDGAITKIKIHLRKIWLLPTFFPAHSKLPQSGGRWNLYNIKSENKTLYRIAKLTRNCCQLIGLGQTVSGFGSIFPTTSGSSEKTWLKEIKYIFRSLEQPFELKIPRQPSSGHRYHRGVQRWFW